jgi:hypothetical protein
MSKVNTTLDVVIPDLCRCDGYKGVDCGGATLRRDENSPP